MLKQLLICWGLVLTPALHSIHSIAPVLADSPRQNQSDRETELLRQDPRVYGSGIRVEIKLLTTKQHPRITPADRLALQKVISNRLMGLNIEKPTFQIDRAGKLIVIINKLERSIEPATIGKTLSATSRLELREQRIGTEGKLAPLLAQLSLLKSQREGLVKSPNKAAIAANQTEIDRKNVALSKLFDRPVITNKNVVAASPEPSASGGNFLDMFTDKEPQPNGFWQIMLEFDRSGSNAFAKLTKNLAGTGRAIGIFLDGDPIGTPTVGAEFAATGIIGGKAVIVGAFTAENASDLARRIRSGVLPVSIEIVSIQKLPSPKN